MADLSGLHILVVPSWWPSPEQPIRGIFFTDYVRAFAAAGAKVGVIFPDPIGLRPLVRTLVRESLLAPILGPVLSRESRRAGHRPADFSMKVSIRPRTYWEDSNGVPVLRVRGFHTALGRLGRQVHAFRSWLARGLNEYQARHGRPDVIHAGIAIPAGWACTHLDDPLAARVVLTEETGPFSLLMNTDVSRELVRAAMSKAARVVTVSQRSRADMQAHGIDREILVCGNPVAEQFAARSIEARKRKAPHRALFVGRIVVEKGVLELADAAASLGAEVDVEWHVAGDGPAVGELRRRFERAGVSRRLILHGPCDRTRIIELMAACDFFVLPSHGETFGQAVAEALCMGLPVITTRGTACEEFVGPDDGVLVHIGDVPSLAAGIRNIVPRLGEYDRIAIADRARRRFSQATVARFYGDLFRGVIGAV